MNVEIRKFKESDFEWIKPIADNWGEWDAAERILKDQNTFALVVEPVAVGALYGDQHGVVLVGTCSKNGIKSFHKLGDEFVRLAEENNLNLHSHCMDKKSWQYKFLTHYLEFNDYNNMLTRYAVKGN